MIQTARFALAVGIASMAAVPFLTGCDSLLGGRFCNLAGCGTELTIHFAGAVPDSFQAVVQRTAENEEQVAVCDDNVCGVREAPPGEFLLEITWGEGESRTETIRPDYERYRPNGPNCGPLCRTASVEVTF